MIGKLIGIASIFINIASFMYLLSALSTDFTTATVSANLYFASIDWTELHFAVMNLHL